MQVQFAWRTKAWSRFIPRIAPCHTTTLSTQRLPSINGFVSYHCPAGELGTRGFLALNPSSAEHDRDDGCTGSATAELIAASSESAPK